MKRVISKASKGPMLNWPNPPFPRHMEDKVVFSRCYSLGQEKTPSIRKIKVPPKDQVIWTITRSLS